MCGRYVRRSDKQKIAEYFHANPQPAELPLPGEDYNVAPTTFQPIIRQSRESGERELILARWSLVPFFTTEFSNIKGLSTINARAESITKAPTWREPMKKRRCIVPASSFYELEEAGKPPKTPHSFELANGHQIGFADLWDAWKDTQGPLAPVLRHRDHRSQRAHEPRPSENAVHPSPSRLRSMARQGSDPTTAARSPPAP